MRDSTIAEIKAHAEREFPRESCGFIAVFRGKDVYMPCRNIASGVGHFAISGEDYAKAEEFGEIIGVVHSHPNVTAKPSQADRVACEQSGLPWHIVPVAIPDGAPEGTAPVAGDIFSFQPEGYEAPYVGRTFSHGILDCYGLIRDWYARELKIDLPNFDRPDGWWNQGFDLYRKNLAETGFLPVSGAPRKGDMCLMQMRAPVPNHAGVYLGDGLILQHCYNRLSSRDRYGGYWQDVTVGWYRHKDAK